VTSDQLLIPAMVVFALLVTGLVLTVMEFKNMDKKQSQKR
jgi:hypothetical protein